LQNATRGRAENLLELAQLLVREDPQMKSGPVLIVDDDLDIREVLAETLETRGFEVVTAANGLEAIELVQSMTIAPSTILLDLMMPVMDGYTFLEQRQQSPTLASIPVAVVTAGHGIDKSRLANSPIVPKPIDVPKLLCVLRDLSASTRTPA
jgi:two-component system response regulator CpxR